THVIRGEDLVNTTPRVLLLRAALGGEGQPTYAHLPLIVNEQRKKLSKRRDDVSVGDYADRGYLPEAMRNYLLTLGWGPKDDIEIRPIEELIDHFELHDINKAPAFFDIKKLDHFNGEYIRMLDLDAFVDASLPYAGAIDPARYRRLAPGVQERVRRYDEVPQFIDWVIGPAPEPTEKDWRKIMGRDEVPAVLDAVIDRLETVEWAPAALEATVLGVGDELGAKSQMPVRLALTGRRSGLPLFEPMAELARDEVLARLRDARGRL
ncbi:MAG: glutamate--tRNA ligase family protein, partial [Actinomycetota bacterium]